MSPDTPIFNTDSCHKHIVNMYEWNLYEQSNVIGISIRLCTVQGAHLVINICKIFNSTIRMALNLDATKELYFAQFLMVLNKCSPNN